MPLYSWWLTFIVSVTDIAPLDATSPLSTKLFSDTTNNPSGRRVELVDSRYETGIKEGFVSKFMKLTQR